MAKKNDKSGKFTKTPTGIAGLDEITQGGLPKNRTTLIAGSVGTGKTIMAMEILIKGALDFNEPGIFMAFEETAEELNQNVASLDFGVKKLIEEKLLYFEHVEIAPTEFLKTGELDLEGLFIRLDRAIEKIGAKRIVLDSLGGFFYRPNNVVFRNEIKRLFAWLKQKEITAIVTEESGEKLLTRQGVEEYVADCVIKLDNRAKNQISTRRLRIVKYRGSAHGNNEYPFTIDEKGVSVFPIITELKEAKVSSERVSSGIKGLDEMLGGEGFFQGSSILVSGSAGTGKTSIAVSLINNVCKKKERCLFCIFEESPAQVARNMNSIGFDLDTYRKSGLLQFYFHRPTLQNLELHLIKIKKIIEEFAPKIVILDPVTNIMSEDINSGIRMMLVKFVDFLKSKQITMLFTAAITLETIKSNPSDEGISSMVDTWLLVRDIEKNGERNRGMYVLKSRGMKHSSQMREFVISEKGIGLIPVFIGNGEILTGSAKKEYSLKEKTGEMLREHEITKNNREIERQRKIMEAGVSSLKTRFESAAEELSNIREEMKIIEEQNTKTHRELESVRGDGEAEKNEKKKKEG